jgi:excisionase family DNA binding protein
MPRGVVTLGSVKEHSRLSQRNSEGRGIELIPLRTTRDACEYLQCTRRFLERMVQSGRLRALKPSRKLVRYRQVDLDAFVESGATIRGAE